MNELSIRDAAKALNVEAHVLRYWEDELRLDIKRDKKGHRYYDDRDIRMFREVQELKSTGLSLKDIRNGIEKQKKEICENNEKEQHTAVSEIEDTIQHEREAVKVVDFKLAQVQTAMNKIVANAFRENKDIITASIREEITTDVMRQFDAVIREKEEREEERFRRLDAVLRQMQLANAEAAATTRKGIFRRNR